MCTTGQNFSINYCIFDNIAQRLEQGNTATKYERAYERLSDMIPLSIRRFHCKLNL